MEKRQGLRFGFVLILAVSLSLFDSTAAEGVTVDAGPNQSSTLPVNSTMIAAVVSGGEFESSNWRVIGGNTSNVTIDSPETLTTPVTFSAAGVYTLEISVIAGRAITDSLVITILEGSAIFRPDMRIGTDSPADSHAGDDTYNEEGNGQRLVLRPERHQPVRFYLSIENDGNVADKISLRGAGIARSRFRVVYMDTTSEPAVNVTKQVLADRYVKDYEPGEIRTFSATVSRRASAGGRGKIQIDPRFKASSQGAPLNLPDVAEARVFFP